MVSSVWVYSWRSESEYAVSRATGSDVMCAEYAIADVVGDGDGQKKGVQMVFSCSRFALASKPRTTSQNVTCGRQPPQCTPLWPKYTSCFYQTFFLHLLPSNCVA